MILANHFPCSKCIMYFSLVFTHHKKYPAEIVHVFNCYHYKFSSKMKPIVNV